MKSAYRSTFEHNLDDTLNSGVKLFWDFPRSLKALLKVATHQKNAGRLRDKYEKQGITVPPLLIISTTSQCNLHCRGCYATEFDPSFRAISRTQMDQLLYQAVDLGCSAVLLAGGEPLLAPAWMEAVAGQTSLLGLVFTNGTLLNEKWIRWFSENRNMIPLFSIEGSAEHTDHRRGEGVSASIHAAMLALHGSRIPFGVSVTAGGHNFKEVTAPEFLEPYIKLGCRLAVYVEYVPVKGADELFSLSMQEKAGLGDFCRQSNEKSKAIHIAFPGDEEQYGGCLAAGRGFAHISASGSLEPCPFAPYSDSNVFDNSLLEALRSPLLRTLREESGRLHEGEGGCALREQRDHILEIMNR